MVHHVIGDSLTGQHEVFTSVLVHGYRGLLFDDLLSPTVTLIITLGLALHKWCVRSLFL